MATVIARRERRILVALALLGLAIGLAAFMFGHGGFALLTAPRYQPTLPVAADVSIPVFNARLAPRHVTTAAWATPVTETTETGNWVRIPSLSINVPLKVTASFDEADVLKALQTGVVRYPNGVEPGQRGIVVIAGHSTGEPWKGPYRFVFLNARKLRAGDTILVDSDGIRYTYRVTGQRVVDPRRTPFIETASAVPRLSLLSCWPLWTTAERLLVDAELASWSHLVPTTPTFERQSASVVGGALLNETMGT